MADTDKTDARLGKESPDERWARLRWLLGAFQSADPGTKARSAAMVAEVLAKELARD